jgi:excinuclease ABC subunit C
MLAVNVFHLRGGKILDRREFFWEELPETAGSSAGEETTEAHGPQASPPANDNDNATRESSDASSAAEGGHAPHTLSSGPQASPSAQSSSEQDAYDQNSPAAPAANENSPVRSEASLRADAQVPGARPKNSGALAPENFHPGSFFSALMKQVYIDQQYVPRDILSPVDFEDRAELEELLSEKRGSRVEILVPQRGEKRSLIDLAAQNAKQSFDQRFRVMKPQAKAVQEALQDALGLPDVPKRIECFDISHIQGAETVASMVVWEDGKMNKSEYRKFIVRTVTGVDDFASMREVVTRRYKRLRDEDKTFPSLVLIDGGLGQLHAAAQALDELGITNQPLAAIAKKEEIIYVLGQEDDPVVLERHSPVLHLVQMVRDESHRFAVTFHRKRRQMRDRQSELLEIPGVGERTRQRLLQHFGSVRAVQQADAAALGAVLTKSQTEAVLRHFGKDSDRADAD